MGADGTEDNVSIKVCSDTNDLCCQNVMKKVPNEDWRSGKKQEWVATDFGDCKNLKFKVIIYFTFSSTRQGGTPGANLITMVKLQTCNFRMKND